MKHFIISMAMVSALLLFPGVLPAEERPLIQDEATPPGGDTRLPVGPMLLGSYGIVAVAFGAGFGWQAYQENEDFNTRVDDGYPYATDALADDIRKHAIAADILMFSGAAAAIGGLVWWLVDDDYDKPRKKNKERTSAGWRPMIGPAHASVTFEF
jgi:hypothetical protein